jgi:succinate-semialdehyde dehydrogenase/glutarate-semialdehyde dehydrogenase
MKLPLLDFINNKTYIAGLWIGAEKGFCVTNPANAEVIATIPNLTHRNITKAIDSAVDGFKIWSHASKSKRTQVLKKFYELIIKHLDELAYIVTLENGKLLDDAKNEILYGASFVKLFADTINIESKTVQNGKTATNKLITDYEPVGVIAAITPWNFPNAMILMKLAPALAAGCSVVLKPSELTPLSALALAKLLEKAGLPAGVLNVITSDDPALVGQILCDDFRVRKLSFTGSTNVGKTLYKNCADTVKRLSLELGGNAPFIILADADLEQVTTDLVTAKIRSVGQSCISPNRILIADEIYEPIIHLLQNKFLSLKSGNGLDPHSNIGAMINSKAVEKALDLISDAIACGAKLVGGGTAVGNFLQPTLIVDCNENMKIFHTEIFAPVLSCYKYRNTEELLKAANNTNYGLQAYLYTKNLKLAIRLANDLDFGMISINDPLPSNANAAFSGRKSSGFGIEGSKNGIFEYLNAKYINIEE